MVEFKSWQSYRQFARDVKTNFRYLRSEDSEDFLRTVLATSADRKVKVESGHTFWRAQLGHDWRTETQDGHEFEVPCPHSRSRMKPLANRAKEGRANPKGLPYLYLATLPETAMSEARPWLGSFVSVGAFKVQRNLTVIACFSDPNQSTGIDIYWEEPSPQKRHERVWADINSAFSEPLDRRDDVAEYVPTQVIAELFKREGYDGIAYKSAFGEKGYNICLFDVDAAVLRYCRLHEVESANFDFGERVAEYWVKSETKSD